MRAVRSARGKAPRGSETQLELVPYIPAARRLLRPSRCRKASLTNPLPWPRSAACRCAAARTSDRAPRGTRWARPRTTPQRAREPSRGSHAHGTLRTISSTALDFRAGPRAGAPTRSVSRFTVLNGSRVGLRAACCDRLRRRAMSIYLAPLSATYLDFAASSDVCALCKHDRSRNSCRAIAMYI
ncbi:hypothetical protein PsYK624_112910 [Phanerochaete sordida]|uniref:Uncharacterized protein n=1 Tax=Phanerochaete sordida TaxID=48140 RepID=A0A9P3LH28_9APHY|nr:hypothetical protein PsYK624_112910 [Phanerochaete sordida]